MQTEKMKKEPLKNKLVNISQTKVETWMAFEEDVKSAVEWLKNQIDNLYQKFPKGEIWRLSNDQVCDQCEDYINKQIDNAFPDLYPSERNKDKKI